MEYKNSIAELKWQMDMGADEALDYMPLDRLAELAEIRKPQNITLKPDNNSVTAPITTGAGFAEPSSYTPLEPKKSRQITSNKTPSSSEAAVTARKLAEKCATLAELKKEINDFEGLAIKKTATNTVFCDGNPNAKIMFISEAPDADEDAQGISLCGENGKLMDEMLNFVELNRKTNIYLANSIFWRPPGNRKPTPEEISICLPFVEKHIALINPSLLVLIGGTATNTLLDTKQSITKLRGKFHDYTNNYLKQTIPTAVLFHPSYILRQPSQKKLFWHDLLALKQLLRDQGIKP